MLLRRIDDESTAFGLAIAGEDILKGSAVVTKVVAGVLTAFLPTTQAEADSVKGFATFRIDTPIGSDKEHEVIKSGTRLVIYTLVKMNMWGTTEFIGEPVAGDQLVVGFTAGTDAGKLRAITAGEVTASRKAQFEVYNTETGKLGMLGWGYEDPIINVFVS
jgi:hypothetical protein